MVRLIDELSAIDAQARMANLDHAARHVLSSKQAPASLAESKAAITAARTASLPASALAKAANYTLALGRNSHASWNTGTRTEQQPRRKL